MKRFKAILLIILVLLLPVTAAAASVEATLRIQANWEGQSLPGIPVQLYQISAMDEKGNLIIRDAYARFSDLLDIQGAHAEKWQTAALTLESYILESGCLPGGTALTDEQGMAEFSSLPAGLYLILGTKTRQNGWVYSTAPFFVLVSGDDSVTAQAKAEREPEQLSLKVIKFWFDEGHEEFRPEQIRVQLHRDGNIYEVITLPENGACEYTWEGLDALHHWSVTEEPMPGYTGTMEQQGNVFILRNYYAAGEKPKLPQTGQLWWPVPVLTAAGLFLMLLGLLRRKEKQ